MKLVQLNKNLDLPEYKTSGSAGMDLHASIDEPITLKPLERTLVSTGIAIELDEGQVGLVCPRSGLALKHGISIVNAPGIIDEDYRGEIGVILVNISSVEYTIMPHERIAQLVITDYRQPKIEVTDTLTDTERGAGGFGSTGK